MEIYRNYVKDCWSNASFALPRVANAPYVNEQNFANPVPRLICDLLMRSLKNNSAPLPQRLIPKSCRWFSARAFSLFQLQAAHDTIFFALPIFIQCHYVYVGIKCIFFIRIVHRMTLLHALLRFVQSIWLLCTFVRYRIHQMGFKMPHQEPIVVQVACRFCTYSYVYIYII